MVFDKLIDVQSELKAPKGQFNSFGKYKYRSVEDIQEAAKPVLKAHGLALTITDDLVDIGGRSFIKATASICDPEDGTHHEVEAYAAIDFNKKGMDSSQVCGSASSYARKYALGGLFLLDDTKDADSMPPEEKNDKEKITQVEAKSSKDRCGGNKDLEGFILNAMGVKKFEDIVYSRYYILVQNWDAYVSKYEAK
jgi:hypothetical protein